jgi:hypothetical protein
MQCNAYQKYVYGTNSCSEVSTHWVIPNLFASKLTWHEPFFDLLYAVPSRQVVFTRIHCLLPGTHVCKINLNNWRFSTFSISIPLKPETCKPLKQFIIEVVFNWNFDTLIWKILHMNHAYCACRMSMNAKNSATIATIWQHARTQYFPLLPSFWPYIFTHRH